jgi:CheY-like chemotaxis protein
VEDDAATARLIGDYFARSGHSCTVLASGKDVLEVLRSGGCDLLILDVMLPHVSGFEICRQIRRDPEIYTLPVLILSAMNSEEEVFHGLAQGADDFVAKPFEVGNLLHRSEALLRASGAGAAIDDLTQLPGADTTKRELQRRISLREGFGVAHCELLRLREFGRKYGPEPRNKAIRHLARALAQCMQELATDTGFVGHMGGGYFIAITPPEHINTYGTWVCKVWDTHIDKLYASLPGVPAPRGTSSIKDVRLDTLFCVTVYEAQAAGTPQQMFEVLSQLRHMALDSQAGGIYIDRRTKIAAERADKSTT